MNEELTDYRVPLFAKIIFVILIIGVIWSGSMIVILTVDYYQSNERCQEAGYDGSYFRYDSFDDWECYNNPPLNDKQKIARGIR